jgi:hypothetical protein
MKAIVVTDHAAGKAGMKLVERPDPQAAINDVVVQVHASAMTGDELLWPSTWTDRAGRDRTPSIPGHELAGIVTSLGYGTTGLSVGQRVFGLTDWYRDGTLAEYVAVEARNLARDRLFLYTVQPAWWVQWRPNSHVLPALMSSVQGAQKVARGHSISVHRSTSISKTKSCMTSAKSIWFSIYSVEILPISPQA